MLVGVLVLVVRIIDVPVLTELEAEWVTMRANTALCFALCGAGLCLLQTQGRHTRRAVRVCAAIVGGIALLTLAEYASGWNSGIGAFFLGDYAASLRPGRMGPNSALCFALMAAGLWLMSRPAGNARRPLVLGWLGSVVAVIGLIALLGHVAGFKLGYGWWIPTVTTVLTASLFVLLGASLLASAWREAGVRWLIEP